MDLSNESIIEAVKLHTRALACHCECLGMNAENCVAACAGIAVPYPETAYQASLLKWGLIGKEGDIAI